MVWSEPLCAGHCASITASDKAACKRLRATRRVGLALTPVVCSDNREAAVAQYGVFKSLVLARVGNVETVAYDSYRATLDIKTSSVGGSIASESESTYYYIPFAGILRAELISLGVTILVGRACSYYRHSFFRFQAVSYYLCNVSQPDSRHRWQAGGPGTVNPDRIC